MEERKGLLLLLSNGTAERVDRCRLFEEGAHVFAVKDVDGRLETRPQIQITVAQSEFTFGRFEIVQTSSDLNDPAVV